MEEQKIVSKEVKMQTVKSGNTTTKQKLSYEELNQACADMSQQIQNQNAYIQRMRQQLQQMDFMLQTKRMDYLFKVVELANDSLSSSYPNTFDREFVASCISEIQKSLTIPEEEEKAEGKED